MTPPPLFALLEPYHIMDQTCGFELFQTNALDEDLIKL